MTAIKSQTTEVLINKIKLWKAADILATWVRHMSMLVFASIWRIIAQQGVIKFPD